MIVRFYLLLSVLFSIVLAVSFDYIFWNRRAYMKEAENVVALSKLASPALSVSWYEPRLRRFEMSKNPSYPELLPVDRLNFVYRNIYGK